MSTSSSAPQSLSKSARSVVLAAAFIGLVFDGFELGLMPVAAPSITKSLLKEPADSALSGQVLKEAIGRWFAMYTASVMLGAAFGGILLGNLGDRIGRTRAMGASILFYSLFGLAGCFVTSQEQMLAMRFLSGLGIGGMWPNGVSLVTECWQGGSRATVSGVLGAGINVGVLTVSLIGYYFPITPDSWRGVFALSGIAALIGLLVLVLVPESPSWLAWRGEVKNAPVRLGEVFRREYFSYTLVAILLSAIPLVGAWAGSKWMIPWADSVAGAHYPSYKSTTQCYWAFGATLGSLLGAPFSARLGKRASYVAISAGATAITWATFRWTAPCAAHFLWIVFAQGFIATMFFGWLPLYLPALFPMRVRATGTGIAMNAGRFITAGGVAAAASLVSLFNGDYSEIGAACAMIYALGIIVAFTIPTNAFDLE